MKLIKRLFLLGVAMGVGLVLMLVGVFYIVKWNADARLYDNVADVPYNKVALLLGTNPVTKWGTQNWYFTLRIEATAELYKAGKISNVIVSGDNNSKQYDESSAMKDALVEAGIPDSVIYLDYAGFRTLDSVVRVKEIFGQTSITIISQRFHNERALRLADYCGVEAVGYCAEDVTLVSKKVEIEIVRESLARVKMYIDMIRVKQPKFLGGKIKIE